MIIFFFQQHSNRFYNVIVSTYEILKNINKKGIIRRKFSLLQDLDNIEYILLTFCLCVTYINKLSYTSIAESVGNNIIYKIYQKSVYNTLNEFKNSINFDKILSIKLGDFFITLLSQYPNDLFERSYKPDSFYTKETSILTFNSEFVEEIKENIIIHPNSLPMICKPNLWSKDKFGGFLENKKLELSLITGSIYHKHKIEDRNNLYKTVNYLNSIKFTINTLLLDFLNNEGNYLLEEIKPSNDLQRIITLKIAEIYKNIPFYLTVNADWRGRIYTQSFFLSYQGGDLSSALLNFYIT